MPSAVSIAEDIVEGYHRLQLVYTSTQPIEASASTWSQMVPTAVCPRSNGSLVGGYQYFVHTVEYQSHNRFTIVNKNK